jgi:hypothetical protein
MYCRLRQGYDGQARVNAALSSLSVRPELVEGLMAFGLKINI